MHCCISFSWFDKRINIKFKIRNNIYIICTAIWKCLICIYAFPSFFHFLFGLCSYLEILFLNPIFFWNYKCYYDTIANNSYNINNVINNHTIVIVIIILIITITIIFILITMIIYNYLEKLNSNNYYITYLYLYYN